MSIDSNRVPEYRGILTETEAREAARAEAEVWYHRLPLFGLGKVDCKDAQWALDQHAGLVYSALSKRYLIVEG